MMEDSLSPLSCSCDTRYVYVQMYVISTRFAHTKSWVIGYQLK